MNTKPKTKLIILLIIWFIWSAGKDLDAFVRFSVTSDYYVFSEIGLAPLYFVIILAIFLLNSTSVYYLFRPTQNGIKFLYSALVAGVILNIVTLTLALKDLPGIRNAYARGRELRGLSVREEGLDLIFNPQSMIIIAVVMISFYALMAFVVYRSKNYFVSAIPSIKA